MDNKSFNENSTEDIVERYRADVKSLVPYLSWLESHAGKASGISETYGGERLSGSISFPVYDSTLLAFVKQAQRTKLIDRNYVYVYSRNHLKTAEDELKFIEKAEIKDMDDLAGILSKYILTGMTKGTVWSEGVQNKVLYSVVAKMQELIHFWGQEKPVRS
ncbi:MAG: hypothetical protein K6A23_16030 [Butyrivibrio sp.]|nr:hypothetical protein [Butyrivibrio sp.]